ncbi:PorV/PorQ family protein [Chitinispirillales bacterium ANBcel5]|uniref:PorV/PorQ family protein n=1 Tax=Cellulosispirillum alkaliphilum TaxID=3039283 RepID=UPI002A543B34|nr:PorV/PorQ family protein [Chitinispirillales bacterium ANBcel5]
MKKIKITISALLLCTALVYSQHSRAGTVAFPFLNLGYDARAVAMGGAATAVPNDIYGVLSNPGAIGFVQTSQIMAGFRPVVMGVWGGPLAYLGTSDRYGNFAANLIVLSSGEIEEFNERGEATGGHARSDYASVAASWGMKVLDDLSAGATFKWIYNRLGTETDRYFADGLALDGGIQYRTNNNRLILGLAVQNVGFMRSGYDSNSYPLPTGISAGISYVPQNTTNLRLALDVDKRRGDYLNFRPGLELMILSDVFLRAGYNLSSKDLGNAIDVLRGERDDTYQKSNMSTLSIGGGVITGIQRTELKLDMAIQFYSDVSRPALLFSVISAF